MAATETAKPESDKQPDKPMIPDSPERIARAVATAPPRPRR
ncbi:hypothetical protein [Candidatus Poriferisodalis sp.]